jgi:hypothetical protein
LVRDCVKKKKKIGLVEKWEEKYRERWKERLLMIQRLNQNASNLAEIEQTHR